MSTIESTPKRRRLLARVRSEARRAPSQPKADQSARDGSIVPLWTELLAQRGLSQPTIDHFQLAPRSQGWTYPVQPGIECARWKAFDSAARPKYQWLPRKSEGITFYNVDGRLHERIAAADHTLWLASGEADVWALWEGGLHNATCMFDGEAKNVPAWFTAELDRMDVRTLHIAPDCDPTGRLFASRLRRALSDSGVALFVHALPFPEDSKGDIGRLLIQVGAARLQRELERLPELAVPDPEPLPVLSAGPARPVEYGEFSDLYERWCVEEVEAAAQRAWPITPRDDKGFSRNFRCPFHDDEHPSAGWNYHTHGVYCFACGSHDTHEVAARLGLRTWEQYKADHAPR